MEQMKQTKQEQPKQQSGDIPAMRSRNNLPGEHNVFKGVKDTLKKPCECATNEGCRREYSLFALTA
ncbi:hypothetical protein [Paraburkholderia fungorum]|uniref:hypothetical protein n=1 Tax=Paraburkholderia fungorum TaxID=134537 RepID=UPI00160110C7|nr:hypothetical protein [Paraburkholderia fungorum]